MNTATRWLLVALALWWSACQVTPDERTDLLRPGMWVQARGAADAAPQIAVVTEMPRPEGARADKLELTAPVQGAGGPGRLLVLGKSIETTDKTEFEDLERRPTSPYQAAPGEWLKVKTRVRAADALQARTVRRVAAADQFEVEGEIVALDRTRRTLQIGGLTLPLTAAVRVRASADPEQGGLRGDPLALFQGDERKAVPFTITLGDTLRMGGELAFAAEYDDEFDLSHARDRDRSSTLAEAKLDALWNPAEGAYALLEARVGNFQRFRENDRDESDNQANVARAYGHLRLDDCAWVQVGRQDFYEEREWLYDEVLDGVRAVLSVGPVDLEGGAALGRAVLDIANPTEHTGTFVGMVRWHVDDDHRISAYVLQRKDYDNTINYEPILYGLRSYARPRHGLGHWLELAVADGYVGRTPIDGQAADVGVQYRFDLPLRPTLVAGYAVATGPHGGKQGFRQSGLQDNNGKFASVTSFKYYGEVLEPELSNLQVTTLAVSVRPLSAVSVDVVHHTYRQTTASPTLVDTNLRQAPDGVSRSLGQGVDLIVGGRVEDRWSAELILGWFAPGAAFVTRDDAHKVAFVVRWKF